jgi:hypothetical protein
MEVELSYDIPELVVMGQSSALKKLGHSNRKVAELITSWPHMAKCTRRIAAATCSRTVRMSEACE